LAVGLGLLATLVALELLRMFQLNGGMLVYTLDDPYIHLALAENIARGTYGVNLGEVAAPSSSILWPFLLAIAGGAEHAPFWINVAAAAATVTLFAATLWRVVPLAAGRTLYVSVVTALFVVVANAVGLIFTGMEHSLQVFAVTAVAAGLIAEAEGARPAPWLFAALVAAPLLRYECLAVSGPALVYLFLRGYRRQSLAAAVALGAALGAFSYWLSAHGLAPLPTSILAKSPLAAGGRLSALKAHLVSSLVDRQGAVLAVAALAFFGYALFAVAGRRRGLALVAVAALAGHFAGGAYGWYNRYEIYVLVFATLLGLYLAAPACARAAAATRHGLAKVLTVTTGAALVAGAYSVLNLTTIPTASNNIYEQHYQMHRFAAEFYRKPIAVKDLGFVTYRNDAYVLDLYGLASLPALRHRLHDPDTAWMDALTAAHGIEAAILYPDMPVPPAWLPVATMRLSRPRITPAMDTVVFYALNAAARDDVAAKLALFAPTLPPGVNLTWARGD
jgi:hypothetical protein